MSIMSASLSILFVEDQRDHVDFLLDRLREGGHSTSVLRYESEFNDLNVDALLKYDLLVLDIKVGTIARAPSDGVQPQGQSAGVRMARRVRVDLGIGQRTLPILVFSIVQHEAVIREIRSLGCEYATKGSVAIIEVLERTLLRLTAGKSD